jgi:hypothetical protein
MYRDKQKRLRKIPEWATAGAVSGRDYRTGEGKGKTRTYKYSSEYEKARKKILARRAAAAKRVEKGLDAFTPNAGAGKMAKRKKKKKTGKASAKKRGKRKTAKKGTRTRAKAKKGGKRKAKKGARKASKRRSGKRKGVGRKKAHKLKKGLYLVANRRRRRRRSARKHYEENRRRRPRRAHASSRRRRHYEENRKYGRRRGRRRSLRRNAFVADLATVAKLGALVLVGFYTHRALTGALTKALTSTDGKFAGMSLSNADGHPSFLSQWQKPITGLVVAGVGIAGVSMVKQVKVETRMAIGAGMMTSLFQSIVTTALTLSKQEQVLSYLEGYSNSPAYDLRGSGRYVPRHLRGRGAAGLGIARNATSIMPQFAPIGAFQQAAAGMGEFFTPQSGMGEYFAGPGTQGVGFYEKAGPLALSPGRSHMGQLPVDDGIRPDSNLDAVLDLAESAAGLGQGFQQAAAGTGAFQQAAAGMGRVGRRGVRGMGEFFAAKAYDGGFSETVVPTSSQWIPNGPLWAGSTPAEAHYTESELPAGILQGPGGNGVLSG